MHTAVNLIAVVPVTHFIGIFMIAFTKFRNLFFRKSRIFGQLARISHRIFVKHIQCGMCAVFFNRQNARHIGKGNIIFIFQPVSDKIKIFFLSFLVVAVFTENAVPFINQNDKRNTSFVAVFVFYFLLIINIFHGTG